MIKTHAYCCKTKIYSGRDSRSVIRELAYKRLLLICDPYFAQSGTADALCRLSGAEETHIYTDIAPDPDTGLIARSAAAIRDFHPDGVVALGGGSTLDCAKAALHLSGIKAQLTAIPTTSGSGSEVTDFAIITHDGHKHPLVDPALCPDVAILDGELLESLPPALIADTGMDALCHALESYVSSGSTPVTRALSEKAFCTLFSLLERSYRGETALRQEILDASCMAGMAFSSSGLGVCHAIAHALGGQLHLPHGRLNAILLPVVVAKNAAHCPSGYAQLARRAGIDGATDALAVKNLKNALCRLQAAMNLPGTLLQAGVEEGTLRQLENAILDSALSDPCCATNPRPVSRQLIQQIIREVTSHA